MSYASFSQFIERLDQADELIRISEPVSVNLEMAAIADLEMKKPGGGKALLFEKPILMDGSESLFPVALNTMGSEKRMAIALGVHDVQEVADQMAYLLKAKPPTSIREGWELLKNGIDVVHARPRKVQNAPCQEVIYDQDSDSGFDLSKLPVLKCWPDDGGPFVTLPNVYTEDPDNGTRNIGMYRMQIFGPWKTGMHWQTHKVAARHGRRYYEEGKPMPVAVALGGDPVFTLAATAPMPDGLDEILLAGFLRKKSVDLVKCLSHDLYVPSEADIVIEGFVDPTEELLEEGPFGDHTGFYTPVEKYPAFRVSRITHRKNAIYPATIVGKPPMEDFYLGTASVKLFLPIIKMNFPEVVDLALPAEGVFHNLMFVSIKKQYPYQAYKVANGLWGMGQMMFTKIIVVVDEDVDVHDTSEVLFRLCANIDPERDTLFSKLPCDSLDHAPSEINIGSHVVFDATRKLAGEGYQRDWPELCRHTPETIEKAKQILSASS